MDYTDTELLPSPQPVRFSHLSGGAEKILKVVCGDDHIMVLTSDGKVFSWGKSSQGQLGIMDESTGDTSKALKLKSKKEPVMLTCFDGHVVKDIFAKRGQGAAILSYVDTSFSAVVPTPSPSSTSGSGATFATALS